mmetsp:Transcript_34721/g.68556  ORF Transcript_34721/g.68556 Transcript_34721/m.68556 type:complete len:122 (+) Transcript_34721:211-576(+)
MARKVTFFAGKRILVETRKECAHHVPAVVGSGPCALTSFFVKVDREGFHACSHTGVCKCKCIPELCFKGHDSSSLLHSKMAAERDFVLLIHSSIPSFLPAMVMRSVRTYDKNTFSFCDVPT